MRNIFLILVTIAISHFGATAAKAQEGHPVYFTFDVPVKLDSIPPVVKKFGVECSVCEGDQCNFFGDGHYHMETNVEHDLPATPEPHSFNGTVTVQMTAYLNSEHHKLSTYSCHLYLKSASTACTVGSYHVDGTAGPNDDSCKSDWTRPQPGAAFVADLHGDLAIDILPPSTTQLPSGSPQASPKAVLPSADITAKPNIVPPILRKK